MTIKTAERRQQRNVDRRATAHARRALGLCYYCNSPAARPQIMCQSCLDQRKAWRGGLVVGEAREVGELAAVQEIADRYSRRLVAGRAAGVPRSERAALRAVIGVAESLRLAIEDAAEERAKREGRE